VRQHVVVIRFDAVEDREAAVREEPHLAAEPAVHHVGEEEPAREQLARAGDLERQALSQRCGGPPAPERFEAPPETIEVFERDVDAVALGEVGAHVLPEVRQLEGGAHVIGARRALVVTMAEETEHDAADRVGGAPAVLEDVGEGGEPAARAGGVAPERRQEVAERLERQVVAGDRVAEGQEHRVARGGRVDRGALESPLELVETRQALGRRRDALVGDVVAEPRERIHRGEIVAQPARQEPGPDREVLVMRAGAGLAFGVCSSERRHAAITSRARS
jgi:hypothetical protein